MVSDDSIGGEMRDGRQTICLRLPLGLKRMGVLVPRDIVRAVVFPSSPQVCVFLSFCVSYFGVVSVSDSVLAHLFCSSPSTSRHYPS